MPTPEAIQKDNELRLQVVKEGLWRSCLNCEHWGPAEANPATSLCHKWGQRPPEEVTIVGCPAHVQDIPF